MSLELTPAALAPDDVYVFPASYGQRRLWFLDQFEPGSPYYNIPSAVRLSGQLDAPTLERALNEIVARHEALRTVFMAVDGEPQQVIYPERRLSVPVIDLRHLPRAERETEALRLARAEARQPFDLRTGPLLRILLLQIADDEHVATLTMHHIVSDGWSMAVLVQELGALYNAFANGRPSPLPELPIQYADYAEWQRGWLQGEILEKQLAYWREQLGDIPPVLELPTDRPRPAVQTSRGASASFRLPQDLSDAIIELGRRESCTAFMTLLAAFETLLHRYCGQSDFAVGTPIANRTQGETEGLIGLFINTLVLRADFTGNPSFRQLLKRTRETALGAFAHQDLPFEMLVEALQPARDMSHTPLFQAMFILQSAPLRAGGETPKLRMEVIEVDTGASTFDLTLSVSQQAQGFHLSVEYSTDLFDSATIERMMAHFRVLLAGIVADPDGPVADLPLLTPDETRTILVEWNDTADPDPLDQCVHERFAAIAAAQPDAIAVAWQGQTLTYGELDRRANQLAHHLRSLGVGPEIRVGVSMEKSPDLIVALLGVLKAGGAYVPIDPAYPPDRIAFMLEDSGAALAITGTGFRVPGSGWVTSSELSVTSYQLHILSVEESQPASRLPLPVTPDHLAYVIYTSGSTGRAKGAMLTHRSLVNAYRGWEREYELGSRVKSHLQMANFSFDVFSGDLVRALLSGGKLVLCPRDFLLSPPDLYALLQSEAIDCAEFVPAVLRNLADYLEATGGDLSFMRVLICASDSWYAGEYRRFLRLCGPETRLINSFGLTEAAIDSCYFEGRDLAHAGDQIVPIGKPFLNVRLYILDERLHPVPVGVRGELFIGGMGVARGYLARPELTAERFIPDPFAAMPGERLYRTGDIARFLPDGGNVEFFGRRDFQLKVRGFRIEPGEIESVLSQHPLVRACAVDALDAPGRGKQLVAYFVADDNATPPASELRRFLQERLPDYMTPGAFVALKTMPLNASGKINRGALPDPDWSERVDASEYVAPRGAAETELADIWAHLLGIKRIGRNDNFFTLGGHSLLATQLVSRIRAAFAVETPLRKVFEAPTLAAQAEWLDIARRSSTGQQAPPIEPVARDGDLPLSFAQQRLWFLDQLQPNSPFYNIPESVRISGPLDLDALTRAFNVVVQRHEALRTTFHALGGRPTQRIHPEFTLDVPLRDLSQLPRAEREAEAARLARLEAQTPFDLSTGPLLRAGVLRLGRDEHVILFTLHHIISDNWSSGLLMREVAACYAALRNGETPRLPPLRLQYADYAAWQRGWLQGDTLDAQLAFWRKQLGGAPPLLELPTDRPRPPVQTFRGDFLTFDIPAEAGAALAHLAQEEGATAFMAHLAAFDALLSRYSGQDDIVVGTPIANRTQAATEPIIGFFVNTLVLRADLSGEPSFRQLLRRLRETALDAYAHQDLPFEMVVEATQPERNLSQSPLFQVMFVHQAARTQAQAVADIRIEPIAAHSGTAKFDLTLFVQEEDGRVRGAFEFNTDLFDRSTIERMATHLTRLLSAAVADPDRPIADLPLLSDAERTQIIEVWNDTAVELPAVNAVHHLFEAQAAATPDRIAVVAGETTLTYAELDGRANQLTHHLRSLGVGPETLVAVCLPRTPDLVIALLGVLKAGGAYVPIDPAYPPDRIAFMLEDSGARFVITNYPLWETGYRYTGIPVYLDTDWPEIVQNPETPPAVEIAPDHPAYVIYTSGSTGKPKGAMLTHGGVINYLRWCQRAYPVHEGVGSPVHSSIAFDLTVTSLFSPLVSGGAVHLIAEDAVDALGAALLAADDFSLVKITPAHLQVLAAQIPPERAAERTRAFIIGGEQLLPEHIAFWQAHAPQTRLVNEYGPTETVVGCAVYTAGPDETFAGAVPIGRPISNTQLYILDRRMQPQPVGVPGELFIGGAGVGRGYHNRPDLTAERFMPNPFGPGRLYRTGDLARFLPGDGNQGCIEFLGRVDDQVKVRGYRIELGEIEAVLSQHPDVAQAAVLALPDASGAKRLVGYVALRPGATLRASDLRAFVARQTPDYMVPSVIVLLDELPLTPNGKIHRRALPAPDGARDLAAAEFVAPRSATEEVIAAIWAELLGLDRVGVDDPFFELGGHSLLATQVISRLRDAFGCELPLRALFEAPTVAGLAVAVDLARAEASGVITPPITAAPRTGDLPLSFAQQRLWFLDQLEPGSPMYNMPTAVRLRGPLDADALAASLQHIVARHEVLRTRYEQRAGQAVQIIDPPGGFDLPLIDLSQLAPDQRDSETRRYVAADAARPFDLAHDRMLRASLLRLAPDDHVLAFTMHHIASDGWSLKVLVRELALLYHAHRQGMPAPLAALPIQYADFAHWQRSWLQGDALDAQLGYWREQLAGAPPLLALPTDRPRPPVPSYRGRAHYFAVPDDLAAALMQISRSEGVTLFMTLLAAYQTLLHRLTGQDDIVIGAPIANRNRSDIEGLIGFFVNTLALRADLADDPNFRQLLARTRETALAAYAHQDLPFERLVDNLGVTRDMSHSPIFQALFTLDTAPDAPQQTLGDLTIAALDAPVTTARFDLTLSTIHGPSGLSAAFEYSTDLFESATIERMAGHFITLLRALVETPAQPVSRAALLSPVELAQLAAFNDTAQPGPWPATALDRFEEIARAMPAASAVTFVGEAGEQSLSYAELDQRANQLAHHLRGLGVGPDTPVAISLDRSIDKIVGLLGILKVGGAYLPLDSSYPTDRLAFMLEDSGAEIVITGDGLRVTGSELPVTSYPQAPHPISRLPLPLLSPDNLAYVIYTSGSTGRPKGVLVPHRGLTNLVWAQTSGFGVQPGDRVLQFAAFSFDAAVSETFMALCTGAELVLAPRDVLASGPDLLDLLRNQRINVVTLPPSLLAALAPDDLPNLRVLISAGEPCTWDIVERWAQGRRFFNAYGPTEATIGPTFAEITDARRSSASVPIGRPIANMRAWVLDRHMQPVPIGVAGELYLGGMGVARGYLNRPDLTAERFAPDPFGDQRGERLYRTGDLARWLPEGSLEYLGRADQQVKIRGFRIEPGEIEAALLRHHGITAAVVVPRAGPGGHRLTAYIVPNAEPAPSLDELRQHLRSTLPEYMIPAAFVTLAELPLTPNGKIDRNALPDVDVRAAQREYIAPRTPAEATLAAVLADLLRLERLGIDDNFFELGGDSILAIQLVARAKQAGLEITPRQLFQYPTIAGLAAVAETGIPTSAEQGLLIGPLPLTPHQRAFLAAHPMDAHAFTESIWIDAPEALDRALLDAAVQQLAAQHDALRTRFAWSESGWRAELMGQPERAPVVWFDPTDSADADARAAELCSGLDLAEGMLLRVAYFDAGVKPGRLLLVVHRLAIDAASWPILLQDLLLIYGQLQQGRSPLLPPKTTSVRAWAERLAALDGDAAFWQQQLAAARLPRDHSTGANTAATTQEVTVTLPAEASRQLLEVAPAAHRAETNELLLTALAQAVSDWSGEGGVGIMLDAADRRALAEHASQGADERMDVSRTVGWLAPSFPLWLDLRGRAQPGECLAAVKEQMRAVPHAGLSFDPVQPIANSLPEVHFEYNDLTATIPAEAAFAPPQPQSHMPPHTLRTHVFNVKCGWAEGCLQVTWQYSAHLHEHATIAALADAFVAALTALIIDAPALETADFSDFGWGQDDIGDIMAQLGA